MGSDSPIPVFIEPGNTWVFASALDWPGWARRGKSEELAVQALSDYLPRYALIVARARLAPVTGTLVVTERHPEVTVNPDFGTLHEIAPSEQRPLSAGEGGRFAALLEAAWAAFDDAATVAPPELRKVRAVAAGTRRRLSGTCTMPRRCTPARWACRATRHRRERRRRSPGGGRTSAPRSATRRAWSHRPEAGHRGSRRGGWAGMCSTTCGRSRTRASNAAWPIAAAGCQAAEFASLTPCSAQQ